MRITGLDRCEPSCPPDQLILRMHNCRDLLAAKVGYREALVSVGGLPLLVSMMKDTKRPATLSVAQCLACVASTPSCRPALRCVRCCGPCNGLWRGQDCL